MTSRPVEEVTCCHDGQEDTQFRPATPRRLARRARTQGPRLPPPGGKARPLVREGVGGAALRQRRQAFGGSGRLLQAPACDVLRGPPFGASTDGGRR